MEIEVHLCRCRVGPKPQLTVSHSWPRRYDGGMSLGAGSQLGIYTIDLQNTGLGFAEVDISDVIPPQAASWSLVDDGNGCAVN